MTQFAGHRGTCAGPQAYFPGAMRLHDSPGLQHTPGQQATFSGQQIAGGWSGKQGNVLGGQVEHSFLLTSEQY
jgi:hypothetical protein